jgi:aconitate hydratase 2/2-methylisocitrate dehydratase
VLWWTGDDIPFVPNKRYGGFCLGGKIAPIFFNTQEDAGAFPIECDVAQMNMGDVIDIFPYDKKVEKNGATISTFDYKSEVLLDEVRAGGRINLIIGRALTGKARDSSACPPSTLFRLPQPPKDSGKGFSLAQKMVGRACGLPEGKGVRPGTYCEPKMTSVGSQDTTGPMTRDELKDLACLGFSADLVMQSFCHTAAYPEAGRRQDPPHPALLHHRARRRLAASRRRRDPLLAEPPAAARHRRHRRRLAHPLPDRHLLPGRLRPGRLRRRHRRHAAGHARIGAGALQGQAAAGITLRDLVNAIPYYAIKAGPADRREAGQEEHLLRAASSKSKACPTSRWNRPSNSPTPPPSVPPPAARCA